MRALSARQRDQVGGQPPSPVPSLKEVHRTREPELGPPAYVRLDRNERLAPLPEWFIAGVRQSLESVLLTTYPMQDKFRCQLAKQFGLAEEQVLLTAGSDAALKALYQAYVRPGDGVVMLDPSYAMYPVYAQMFQAEARLVPFHAGLALDATRLLDAVVRGVRLVVLANPNQPTGTVLPEAVLEQLVERAAVAGAVLAIDEAYHPFSRVTVLPWINRVAHLVVTRTFSKAAGLAGLRIGFVAGHPEVMANLHKVRSAHDVNSMAIHCAAQLLAHPQVVDEYVAEVHAGGRVLTERVRALGLTPIPTHTNFLLIRVSHRCPPGELVERLRARGYLVKGPFSAPCLADCIRVTLGPPDLMERFAVCLGEVLA